MTDPHSNIFFAKPRHPYTSYTDLYQLIDLSGFATCYIDEIQPDSNNAYIITILNGELPEGGYPDARAKIVLWDNEWHMDGVPVLPGVEYWASDKWYAKQINARYVPMGSHPDLCPEVTPKVDMYDVAFYGYFDGVPRRQVIRQQLLERGVKVSPTGAWGAARHQMLRNSATYLHVHQLANAPTIAPLRMVVAAAYALPIISETCADYGRFESYVLAAEYDRIAECAQLWTKPSMWQQAMEYGHHLHQLLCHDLTFRKSVEAAL